MVARLIARLSVVSLCAAHVACGEVSDADAPPLGAQDLPIEGLTCGLSVENGITLNGLGSNGITLNGLDSNGITLNGIGANGTKANGTKANGTKANGTRANGTRANALALNDARFGVALEGSALVQTIGGVRIPGVDFTGAILGVGESDDGLPVEIRIDGVENDGDHVLYSMTWRAGDGEWTPVCNDYEGRPDATRKVTLLRGAWDPETGDKSTDGDLVTLACDGYAIAKCVHMGYAPWRTQRVCDGDACREISLETHHQACTRMVRADYCGDGRSHTVNGTLINLYDGVGLQADEGGEGWTLEAEWGVNGATCVNSTRIAALSEGCTTPCLEALRRDPLPDCGAREHLALSGDPGAPGQVLLMTEHPAR